MCAVIIFPRLLVPAFQLRFSQIALKSRGHDATTTRTTTYITGSYFVSFLRCSPSLTCHRSEDNVDRIVSLLRQHGGTKPCAWSAEPRATSSNGWADAGKAANDVKYHVRQSAGPHHGTLLPLCISITTPLILSSEQTCFGATACRPRHPQSWIRS